MGRPVSSAGGIAPTGAKRYRTKLELFRDVLAAAQTESVKTRIKNRANMSPASFSRYLSMCQDRQLIVAVSGGYSLTPRAEELLELMNQVLSKATQLRVAIDVLNQTARSGGYQAATGRDPARLLRDAGFADLMSPDLRRVDRRATLIRRD